MVGLSYRRSSNPEIQWRELLDRASKVPNLIESVRKYEGLLRTLYAVDASAEELAILTPLASPYQAQSFLRYAQRNGFVSKTGTGRYQLTEAGHQEVRRVRSTLQRLVSTAFGPPDRDDDYIEPGVV